jgi:hypothetical protein
MPNKTGPRDGKTTLTAGGLLKKTIYLDPEEWAALRKDYDEDRPISEIHPRSNKNGLEA